MKRFKRIVSIILMIGIVISSSQVFANSDLEKYIGEPNITEEFKAWLELSEEEKGNVLMPRSYDVLDYKYTYNNPIRLAQTIGSATLAEYDLRDYIPENVTIKNQMQTNSCWTFASLGALESNLALSDYKNNKESKVYDFSERHMEYATTRKFKNGEVNLFGFSRIAGEGGNYYVSRPYMVNGWGPINEKEMPFENNENEIELKEIQGKTVVAQVYDTIEFPQHTSSDDKTEIIKQMKEHIRKNGGIEAGIYGADIVSDYYNKETGAIYCDSAEACPYNHDVVIIDNLSNSKIDVKDKIEKIVENVDVIKSIIDFDGEAGRVFSVLNRCAEKEKSEDVYFVIKTRNGNARLRQMGNASRIRKRPQL